GFLSKLGNDINQKANKEWALSSNDSLSKINIELKDVTKYLINDDTLIKYLEDASGPTNSASVANYDSPNPHWPNSGANWSYQFPPRATKGIKNAVDASLKAIVTVVNENKATIQNSLSKALEQVQKEVSDKSKSLQLRSELLWWKEAGYSSSTDKSYDELDRKILGIVLANDYSTFIPLIYPKSVDYFLKETYKGLKESTTEELTLEDFLKTIQEHAEELKLLLPSEDVLASKLTLLNFINGLIWNKYQLAQFEEFVGIPINIKLFSYEVAIWLFHDFQLAKILNAK
ncbi:MAG TPA: GTPase-associated system all-helical protein GASH, partial [Aequorivita sp.]|nr:GTPase-associated system all-helical protein GASH [Aequorivita sp.]